MSASKLMENITIEFTGLAGKVTVMAKCKQCNVTILDNTTVCPLCQCVLEADGSDMWEAAAESPRINEYPDVWLKQRKIKQFCNLILVAVLGASAILAVINLAFSKDSWWCLIPIAAMAYVYVVFRLVFVSRKGYRWKVFVPLILALILLLIIDIETGSYGWSMNYVFPCGILVTDLIILILMLTNIRNWQSYMIMQIAMIVVSLIPMVLWAGGIITSPLLSVIAVGVSVFMFLGALILGDRTARCELKRRFHIK